MVRLSLPRASKSPMPTTVAPGLPRLRGVAIALAALLACASGAAQVITINTGGGKNAPIANGPVDRQYQQIQPTHVDLPNAPMDTKDRLEVVRIMQAEQGFAMRPMPGGHKGLTLTANGNLDPAGEPYLNMVSSQGMAIKPGGRAVITDVKIEKDKIVFDLNGGPDGKHRFLSHVSVGTGTNSDAPVVADKGEPGGSRLTLSFKEHVPVLTGAQVKALLAPLISFEVKAPAQAYTDTLPKPLKEAILDHQVLVGMNTDMVFYAKGQPVNKIREMDGQTPIEIWLYGAAPEDVTFVRINGNRVIRVEIAKVGKPVQVFDKDVVSDMMRADGKPATEEAQNVRVIKEGDVQRDPDKQAPAVPPTLGKPGETMPDDANRSAGQMKPVHFPKQQPDDAPVAHKPPAQQPPATQPTAQPGENPDDQEKPSSGQGAPQAAPGQGTAPSGGSSQPN